MAMGRRIRTTLSLDAGMVRELDDISIELKEKKSHLIEQAWQFYLDYLDVRIAEKRLAALKSGKTRAIPAKKVFKDLGLD
jgi:metal-responsive CopG/Arc/MetJ family transcriptional regulator